MESLLNLDGNFLLYLQDNVRNEVLTAIMRFITSLGGYGGALWIVSAITLVIIPKTRKAGVCSMLSLLFMGISCNLTLKVIINRTRPYEVIDRLKLITDKPGDASFPSGHTAVIFAFAVSMTLSLTMIVRKKWATIISIALFIVAVLVAFSRLYLGVHYPSDVLGGMVVGSLCGCAGVFVGKKLIKRFPVLSGNRDEKKENESESEKDSVNDEDEVE